ncbi:MAG TPA: hypothetical protein DCP97_01330 [Ruminococcaceae bacterium]|nr:hypothetical protein [Oscillospiraceae bacterium]
MAMTRENIAYNFDMFDPQARQKSPDLQLIKPQTVKNAFSLRTTALIIIVTLALGFSIYNRAILNEISNDIAYQTKQLNALKLENDRLTAELNAKVSMRNIEEYATTQLGMSKPEPYQINYVKLSQQDKAEVLNSGMHENLLSAITNLFNSFMEYVGLK